MKSLVKNITENKFKTAITKLSEMYIRKFSDFKKSVLGRLQNFNELKNQTDKIEEIIKNIVNEYTVKHLIRSQMNDTIALVNYKKIS